jgi:hypothetical protein
MKLQNSEEKFSSDQGKFAEKSYITIFSGPIINNYYSKTTNPFKDEGSDAGRKSLKNLLHTRQH